MNYRALFLISLGINVVLALWLLQKDRAAPKLTSKESQQPVPAVSLSASASGTIQEERRFVWGSVESPDYRHYIQNLRAVGCPEQTLRDIIEADVMKLYDEKKARLRKAAPRFEYWKGDSFLQGAGREAWIKMRALDEERDKVLRDLGVEPNYSKRALKQQNGRDWMFDFLSDEKRQDIIRLQQKLADALAMRDPNVTDEAAQRALFKEHEAAVKRLLNPEAAFQYDLRMSPVAQGLRNEMRYMDPTEQEFINLYKVRAAHQSDVQPLDPKASEAERRAAREREKESNEKLQEQMREVLGVDRYADYQMAQDWRYGFIHKFAQEASLGMSEMKQIYQIRREAEHAAEQIESSSGLSTEARAGALQGIRKEAERAISGAVGQQTWGKYQSEGHAGWLNSIHKAPVSQ